MGNLKPIRNGQEAKNMGHKGGVASGKSRRRKRDIRFLLLALLDSDIDGQTGAEAIALAIFHKALNGDLNAIKLVTSWSLVANNITEAEEEGLLF